MSPSKTRKKKVVKAMLPSKRAKDITGQTFNRLTAIKYIKTHQGHPYWLFKCSCGKQIVSLKSRVKNGRAKSCGCLSRELVIERSTKHGEFTGNKATHFYKKWQGMKSRCTFSSKSNKLYYQDRNIKICKRWHSFISFKKDMYQTYMAHVKKHGEKETTLDRINNNRGYSLSNCKWATRKEQIANRRPPYGTGTGKSRTSLLKYKQILCKNS